MQTIVEVNNLKLKAELFDSAIVKSLISHMPIQSRADLWSGEVYFSVPIVEENVNPKKELKVGDIVYWKECGCVGIFYGKTKLSTGEDPVAVEPVTVIGRMIDDCSVLESVKHRDKISLKLA